tara:strand:- start:191 stop:484 length:294 start_codon:yes stop_codon:yes gene_type:complete
LLHTILQIVYVSFLTALSADANIVFVRTVLRSAAKQEITMPFARGFGMMELVLILVIVVIIFGVGRFSEVGSGLGKGIRQFRRGLSGKDSNDKPDED